jgi:hypothetical protein
MVYNEMYRTNVILVCIDPVQIYVKLKSTLKYFEIRHFIMKTISDDEVQQRLDIIIIYNCLKKTFFDVVVSYLTICDENNF